MEKVTKDKLYQSALHLYEVRDAMEEHLSNRTNNLFDLEDKIILYDLTNTYFEGEKRKDAKLVVLALEVNIEDFIKYSSVLEGNIADNKTLSAMIEKLSTHTCNTKAAVVLNELRYPEFVTKDLQTINL